MRRLLTTAALLSITATLSLACGEETCKTICTRCEAVEQSACREDCKDAYTGTSDCRNKLKNLEDCVRTNQCDSTACRSQVNLVEDVCNLDLDDYR